MAEYIDRGTFKKSVEERYCKPCKAEGKDHNGCWCRACWVDDMLDEVDCFQPADVAPVVRCKDCEWFADNNDGSWFGCWLFQTIRIIPEDAPKPDDFCSYGELKMDGGGDR